MDRTEASRHIAKVFAYIAVGKMKDAHVHAQLLIDWLQHI